jgi:small-conductance mechanosensitive channel
LQAFVESVRRIAFAAGIVRGLLAPLRPTWRLMELSDSAALRLANLFMGVVIIVSLMKVIEAINELIAVSLPVAVVVRAMGATAVALLMAVSLKGIMAPSQSDDECLGPVVEPGQDWSGPVRFVAWIAIVAVLGSVLIGYVAFGAFVTDQIVWVTFVGCVTYMLVLFANEGFEHALRPPAPIARAVMSSLGLRRESLEQLGVLLAGVATVSLTAAAVLLVLAPWGIESDDMLANLRSAFFGFKIGDVTISLASIALALFFFAVVLFVTRTVQRWLEKKLLPHTQLDTGLRNSIRTSIGYVGFIVAVAISLGYLGFSFEKLAIVAGALSVGIGFGLQSIVNNFVSGLILLWERAVRVGDLVVLGEEQGYVRRINVRSTEIETFDRVTMIVPNSNLVTGVVKNWVRGDKIGRIKIPVAVNLEADPEHVRTVLIDVAKQHEMVEKLPAPNVMFIAMTESLLKFELICFVGDVEKAGRVKSDLHFAIHARFKIENINISPPAAPAPIIHIDGLDTLKKQD